MPSVDITGQRFGRYIALRVDRARTTTEITYWQCRCDCGIEKSVSLSTLRGRAPTISCGCLRRELIAVRFNKHGMAKTPEYHAWQALRQRCQTPHHPEYRNYGARGITVCERWQESFENFIADMGLRPSSQHSIERLNNDAGYSPDNCVWATREAQLSNKRSVHRLTHNGKTMTAAAWGAELNIDPRVIGERLKDGWTVHTALTTPSHRRFRPAVRTSATAR